MAVINEYVNSDVAAEKLINAAFIHGAAVQIAVVTFEVAAADSDTSKYRLLKNVPADLIPVKIEILADAITSGSDYDLGFYEPLEFGGAVIDADALMDGVDFSSGFARGSEQNGLAAVDVANVQKRIYELAGHSLSTKKLGYDIVLTANTVGSSAGTISAIFYFVQG